MALQSDLGRANSRAIYRKLVSKLMNAYYAKLSVIATIYGEAWLKTQSGKCENPWGDDL